MEYLAVICLIVLFVICTFDSYRLKDIVLPGGYFTTTVIGVTGAWMGLRTFGDFGPKVGGISLIPSIAGSMILVICLDALLRRFGSSRSLGSTRNSL